MVLLLSLKLIHSQGRLPESNPGMILSLPAIPNEMRHSLHHILQYFVACLPRYVTWEPYWAFMIFSWIYIRPLTSRYNSIILFQLGQLTHNR
jgi:hypothetical protein